MSILNFSYIFVRSFGTERNILQVQLFGVYKELKVGFGRAGPSVGLETTCSISLFDLQLSVSWLALAHINRKAVTFRITEARLSETLGAKR